MPRSRLVEVWVEAGVEVEVGVEVKVGLRLGLRLRLRLMVRLGLGGWAYFFGRVGWVVGESEDKAKLNSSCS